MKVREIVPTQDAWQYVEGAPRPSWVTAGVVRTTSGLMLNRTSGLQELRSGEWLVKNLDAIEPEWFTDAGFHAKFEPR